MNRNKIYLRTIKNLFKLRKLVEDEQIKADLDNVIKRLIKKRNLKYFNFDGFIDAALLDKQARIKPLRIIKNKALLQKFCLDDKRLRIFYEMLIHDYRGGDYFVPYVKKIFETSSLHDDAVKLAKKIEAEFNRDVKLSKKDYDRALAVEGLEERIIALTDGLLDDKCRIGSAVSVLYVKALINNLHSFLEEKKK